MEGDAVEGPVVSVCRDEVVQVVLNEMKTGKSLHFHMYHWSLYTASG